MPKGISLHIGVNEVHPDGYGGWTGPLKGCEHDANDMDEIAARQGFQHRLLKTAEATHDAVTSGIQEAAERLEPDDFFFLTYSGHGSQVEDVRGDEPEGMDETWCLYDKQLLDDELRHLWPQFREGVRILVLSDSCHSGTVTRAEPGDDPVFVELMAFLRRLYTERPEAFRCAPPDKAWDAYQAKAGYYQEVQRNLPEEPAEIRATVCLISGCQDNQLSYDGPRNGRFTGKLRSVWGGGSFEGSYADFHSQIVARMPPIQTPNHFVIGQSNPAFAAQKPFVI